MRVTVVGASGEFGAIVSDLLERQGTRVTRAHRRTGVDAVTGDGLAAACDGAEVIVDATNLMSFSAGKSVDFFEAVAGNVSRVARESGAKVVYLTIYGAADPAVNARMGHYRGKAAQERVYADALGADATAVASTQWFTLPETFLSMLSIGPIGAAPDWPSRPAAVEEVAAAAAGVVLDPLRPQRLVVAGPEEMSLADAAKAIAARRGRPKKVFALGFGGRAIASGGLVPDDPDVITATTFGDWLAGR